MTSSFPTAVIITAKNAAETIGHAVRSALAQDCVTEVMVVDDGSSDGTSAAAAAADDGTGRLRATRFEVNRGPSAGRNAAIEASTAPFLCILDADDFMSPGRLERLYARGGQDWDLLADDILFASEAREDAVFDRLLPDDFPLPSHLTLSRFGEGNLPRRNRHRRELGFLKPVMRRAFLDAHGVRYDERLRLGEDLLFYARCLIEGGRFKVVEACGYHAVQYPSSLSAQHRTHDLAALHRALAEFEADARRQGRPIGELAAYIRSTRNNLAFREALDARREAGLAAGIAAALRSHPSSTGYIIGAFARAKVTAALDRLRP